MVFLKKSYFRGDCKYRKGIDSVWYSNLSLENSSCNGWEVVYG